MSQPMEARSVGTSSAMRRVAVAPGAPPGPNRMSPQRALLLLLLRAAETAEEPLDLDPEPTPTVNHQPEPMEA